MVEQPTDRIVLTLLDMSFLFNKDFKALFDQPDCPVNEMKVSFLFNKNTCDHLFDPVVIYMNCNTPGPCHTFVNNLVEVVRTNSPIMQDDVTHPASVKIDHGIHHLPFAGRYKTLRLSPYETLLAARSAADQMTYFQRILPKSTRRGNLPGARLMSAIGSVMRQGRSAGTITNRGFRRSPEGTRIVSSGFTP